MKIPKYVIELMKRSTYDFNCSIQDKNYAAGYTINIKKKSEYQKIESFKEEIENICKWANRISGNETAYILYLPNKTHYTKQYATITIFDPVMKQIEQYIQK